MKNLIFLAMFFGLPWITGCKRTAVSESSAAPSIVTKVAMKDMQFAPSTVEIKVGGTVEWTNDDITPHTATSPVFGDSGAVLSDKTWSHTFNDAGDFPSGCTFHPDMKGTVVVK